MSCLYILQTLCSRHFANTLLKVSGPFLKNVQFPRIVCKTVETLPSKCCLLSDHISRARTFEVSTVDCALAECIDAGVGKFAYTLEILELWQKMKHKTNKNNHKHKRKHKHHKQKKLERRNQRDNSKKLKRLAMSSGFQGPSLPLRCVSPVDQNDDIVVVYDKSEEKRKMEDSEKLQQGSKCIPPVNLEDIPLPPGRWTSHLQRGNECTSLENIPLPTGPNPSFLKRENSTSECLNICGDKHQEENGLKQLLKNFRRWENTEWGDMMDLDNNESNMTRKPNSFTVMSYNVLAQELLEGHQSLYKRHDRRALGWEYRSSALLKEIQEANADILCLQEVQASHIDSFYNQLHELGYKGLFKQRTNGKVDGCALYYKADKFKLLESATVEYYQYYQPTLSILDRDNIAIIARLEFKDSLGIDENQIVVATTHLLYNPRRHDVKLAQTQVLLAELDRISFLKYDKTTGKPIYHPTILTGDFNLEPNTAVYKLLVEGFLLYSHLSAKSLITPVYGQRQESLIPPVLQISNSCQHLGLLQKRARQDMMFTGTQQDCIDFIRLYNSDYYKSPQQYLRVQSTKPQLDEDYVFQALWNLRTKKGCLYHNMNFLSVYKHQRQSSTSKKMAREATTHQDDWVTVDYIFYSGIWNEEDQCVKEGPLKLLSRYTLPTSDQCHQLKAIPNMACGSDHLSLMAHFVLVPTK